MKFLKMMAMMALVAGTAACSVETLVDDLEAQAKAQAEAKLKEAFSTAVTQAALKAVEQGQGAQDGGAPAAPGYSKANTDMSMNETFEINDSFTDPDGTAYTMTGKITMNMEGMNSTMTMDMKMTFTNMKVKLDDGTEELVNGEQTLTGDFTTEMSDPNDMSTMVMKMSMKTAGKITNLAGTAEATFEITMTFDSSTGVMKIEGNIDGEPYTEEFTMELGEDFEGEPMPEEPGDTIAYASCTDNYGDVCYEYVGSAYASMTSAQCPDPAPNFTAATACDSTYMTYVCTVGAGGPQEYRVYSITDESTTCAGLGGTWETL